MTSRFWISHLVVPLGAATLLLSLISAYGWDEALARHLFFDVQQTVWLGKGSGEWWARDVLHTGGRNVVRTIAATALVCWALSYRVTRLRPLRSAAGYVAISMIVATTTIGALKAVTNVDCPWDLAEFGGTRPHIGVLQDRPDWLPRAKCFPGAHSASGFALMCLYFAFYSRPGRTKYAGLAVGLGTGVLFAVGQEARGAHFVSHDLVSATLVWIILVLIFVATRGAELKANDEPGDELRNLKPDSG